MDSAGESTYDCQNRIYQTSVEFNFGVTTNDVNVDVGPSSLWIREGLEQTIGCPVGRFVALALETQVDVLSDY